jgi:iron(III) transport system substrate-binding protein
MDKKRPKLLKVIIFACVIVAIALTFFLWGSRQQMPKVVIYTSVDQPLAGKIFREFEKETGIPVRAVFDSEQTKSLGLVGLLLAESANPKADVFWSGDPAHSLLLVNRGIVQPYISSAAADIPSEFKSPDGSWTGLAARARVLLVNKNGLASREMPSSIRDLTNPRWKGQAVIANPMFGTAAYQIAALLTVWGDEKAKEFLEDLKANDVRIARSHAEVKGLVLGGEVAFGLLDTDDAAEAMKEQSTVEIVYPDQQDLGTLVIPSTLVLIRGAPNAEGGKRLIDFLLSKKIEQQMVESGEYIPLRPGIPAPRNIRKMGDFKMMRINYAKVADEMDEEMQPIQPWLRKWVER